jgi:hypothetical protein
MISLGTRVGATCLTIAGSRASPSLSRHFKRRTRSDPWRRREERRHEHSPRKRSSGASAIRLPLVSSLPTYAPLLHGRTAGSNVCRFAGLRRQIAV